MAAFTPESSAESNFRELDDAFLQAQTRIWLGEVLQIRLDERMDISDLLADGELLFEVSEVISRMWPTPALEATHVKVNEWKYVASSKSTRRYMHYDNVGSFLRICKHLGLDGVDLFSPSDVVEKRNTRKVCMCIRSLSKGARLRDLNVPDFDSVTRTLAMPTDMVKCIRKSLELSQCSSSLSVGHDSEKVSTAKCWQRTPNSASAISSDHSSEICDDAQSSYIIAEGNGLSDYSCDITSPSIKFSQVVRDHSIDLELHLNNEELEIDENDMCEYLSPSISESVGSPCSQYYSDQEMNSVPSSTCVGSRISGKVPDENNEIKYGCGNGNVNHVPIDWGDTSLDVGDNRDGNANNRETDTSCCCSCSPTREENTPKVSTENPSEIDSERRSCHNNGWIDHDKSIFVGRRNLGLPHECVVEDDFCVNEAPISVIESPETGFMGVDVSSCPHMPHLDLNHSTSVVMAKDCIRDTEESQDTKEKSEESHQQYAVNMDKGESEESEDKNTDRETTQSKPQGRLLKSIIKGTALVGVAVFLLHLRKTSSRTNPPKPKEKPKEVLKRNTPKPSSQKGGSRRGVYPAEKLRLGI